MGESCVVYLMYSDTCSSSRLCAAFVPSFVKESQGKNECLNIDMTNTIHFCLCTNKHLMKFPLILSGDFNLNFTSDIQYQ